MERFLGLITLTLTVFLFVLGGQVQPTFAAQPAATDFVVTKNPLRTLSVFQQKTETVSYPVSFTVRYLEDPERDFGELFVEQPGVKGQRTETYETAYWGQEEISRRLTKNEVTKPPVEEIVRKGTRKVFLSGNFERCGDVVYAGKLKMWSTSYDKFCQGCSGITYTGRPAGYGIVAVDPKVIPLLSRLCIPGYGLAVAGDIGGGIKGAKIDLGFDNVKEGWWSARWTDVYLLQ